MKTSQNEEEMPLQFFSFCFFTDLFTFFHESSCTSLITSRITSLVTFLITSLIIMVKTRDESPRMVKQLPYGGFFTSLTSKGWDSSTSKC